MCSFARCFCYGACHFLPDTVPAICATKRDQYELQHQDRFPVSHLELRCQSNICEKKQLLTECQ